MILSTRAAKIQQVILTSFMQHISCYCVTRPCNLLEVLICLKLFQNVIETFGSKVLLLDFDEFLKVVLELALLELFEVVSAQDHVLD